MPRTEAGKRLWDAGALHAWDCFGGVPCNCGLDNAIDAIERDASFDPKVHHCIPDRDALAGILHDIYGCRITCRGGRLADDRHPSHTEAYLDTAERIIAALEAGDATD